MHKTVLTSFIVWCLFFTAFIVGYKAFESGSVEPRVHYSPADFIEDSVFEQNLSLAADFLNNTQFNPVVGLCREAPNVANNTYWLVSDNLFAYHALKYYHHETSNIIYETMLNYGYFRSYKHEAIFGATIPYIPPKTCNSYVIDETETNIIKTEVCNVTTMSDYQEYADLCIYAALHYYWIGEVSEAISHFEIAENMWDGIGLDDKAATGSYSTYKLALLLYASRILGQPLENKTSIEETLWLMQDEIDGGFHTDYDINFNYTASDMNTETTSFAIIAYKYQPKVVNRPAQHPPSLDIPPDYERIQEAINDATEGDTIFVYNGTYYEHVVVNKTLTLIGENGSTTIIDGEGTGNVVEMTANNVTFECFTIRNGKCGIYLEGSHGNYIGENTVLENQFGILVSMNSSYNTIIRNIVPENDYGILLVGEYPTVPIENTIYHNNFINNKIQADTSVSGANIWDDGYPSGGNYWSDYNGTDLNQDGVGEINYEIDFYNIDHHPLMGIFSSFNTTLAKHVNVISNSIVEDFEYFEFNSTIRMYVANMTTSQTYGFCRVCIPKGLVSPPYSVIIDDGATLVLHQNYTLYDNDTHRWIYFAYEHSTHKIDIVPEFSSFIIMPLFMVVTLLAATVYRRKHTIVTEGIIATAKESRASIV